MWAVPTPIVACSGRNKSYYPRSGRQVVHSSPAAAAPPSLLDGPTVVLYRLPTGAQRPSIAAEIIAPTAEAAIAAAAMPPSRCRHPVFVHMIAAACSCLPHPEPSTAGCVLPKQLIAQHAGRQASVLLWRLGLDGCRDGLSCARLARGAAFGSTTQLVRMPG